MPLDFPSSPTLNQVYTSSGTSWKWNGYAWDAFNPYNTIRRFATSGSFLYCGIALTGSSEASAVWTITRLTIAADGSVSATATAQPAGGVAWNDYLTAIYS
jgi:hypothetical protein